jgi:phytol kinase
MLAILACLFGIFIILVAGELLWQNHLLKDENQRKFVHILAGSFIAFWPWLISWRSIQFISLLMVIVTLFNHRLKIFNHLGKHRYDYGDVLFAVGVFLCSLITTQKTLFALAVLQMALADGLAAVIGKKFGKHWRYKVFDEERTIIGSMTFWVVSLCILGTGFIVASNLMAYSTYAALLLLLPPALVLLENVTTRGFDNVLVPVVALIILNFAAVHSLIL